MNFCGFRLSCVCSDQLVTSQEENSSDQVHTQQNSGTVAYCILFGPRMVHGDRREVNIMIASVTGVNSLHMHKMYAYILLPERY